MNLKNRFSITVRIETLNIIQVDIFFKKNLNSVFGNDIL
jgi:hypothetical protein